MADEDLDKSRKLPCILHMDSIKGNHAGLKNLIQRYLYDSEFILPLGLYMSLLKKNIHKHLFLQPLFLL